MRNIIPCVLYGNDVENQALQCEGNVLHKVYAAAGETTLVDLDANGTSVPVLFQAIDFEPVSGRIIHADFYAVNMKKEIEAHIPLTFIGDAPAVKDLGGVLVHANDHVWVKCLPGNLPHTIEADISSLATFQDAFTVADLKLPDGVAIKEEEDLVLALVQEPRAEEPEEVAPVVEATAETASAETEEGDKKEE